MKLPGQSEQSRDSGTNSLLVAARTLGGLKRRVLLVREESNARCKLVEELHEAELEIEPASTAPIALDKVDEIHLDAIMIDAAFADINAAELSKLLRKKQPDLPIFVYGTNEPLDIWPGRVSKSRIGKFFFKPGTPPEEIVTEVVSCLGAKPRRRSQSRNRGRENPGVIIAQGGPHDTQSFALMPPPPPPSALPPSRTGTKPREAQRKYWAGKADELALENIRLQKRLAANEDLQQAKTAAEAASQTEASRRKQLQEDLMSARQERDQLSTRLAQEQREAADIRNRTGGLIEEVAQLKSELEHRVSDAAAIQAELTAQLVAARTATAKAQLARRQEAQRADQITGELDSLRQSRAELNGKLAHEKELAAQYQRRGEELARQLTTSTLNLQQAKAELSRQTAAESDLRQQLGNAKAAAERAEAELAALRRSRESLNGKLVNAQEQAAEAARDNRELEQKLDASAVEVATLKADLEQQRDERASLAKELENTTAAYNEQSARLARLDDEVATLRRTQDEITRKLQAEEDALAETLREKHELEDKLRQTSAELSVVTTERASSVEEVQSLKAAADRAQETFREHTSRLNDELSAVRRTQREISGQPSSREMDELEQKLRENGAEIAMLKAEVQQHRAFRAALAREVEAVKAACEKAQAACSA